MHHPHQVRELQRDDAGRSEQDAEALDEVVDVGDVRQHVVAEHEIRREAFGLQCRGGLGAEEGDAARDAGGDRRLGDAARGLDAEDRDATLLEVFSR